MVERRVVDVTLSWTSIFGDILTCDNQKHVDFKEKPKEIIKEKSFKLKIQEQEEIIKQKDKKIADQDKLIEALEAQNEEYLLVVEGAQQFLTEAAEEKNSLEERCVALGKLLKEQRQTIRKLKQELKEQKAEGSEPLVEEEEEEEKQEDGEILAM